MAVLLPRERGFIEERLAGADQTGKQDVVKRGAFPVPYAHGG
jgi:hypothetical protein